MARTRTEGGTEDANVGYFEGTMGLAGQRGIDVAFTLVPPSEATWERRPCKDLGQTVGPRRMARKGLLVLCQ